MVSCKKHKNFDPKTHTPDPVCLPCNYIWKMDQIRQGKVSLKDRIALQEGCQKMPPHRPHG